MKQLLFTLSIINFCMLSGQVDTKFSLLDAKEYALKNHINVINSDLEYNKAIQKKKEYLSAGMPEAFINAGYTQFINLPVQVIDASFFNPMAQQGDVIAFRAGTEFNSSASLRVNQLLFDGSYFVGVEASRLLVDLQSIQKSRTREEVLFSVIEAYHIATIAKENKSFVDSILQITQQLEEKQKGILDLGLMSEEEFDQIQYAVLKTENLTTNAALQYENALALLKYSMNYNQDSAIELSTSLEDLQKSSMTPSLGSISDNSVLKLLENQVRLSACDVKNNKAGFLPSLSAFFQQGYNAYRTSFDFFQDKPWYSQTSWGIQMTVPVFSSGKGRATLKQAEIQYMQAANTLKNTENGLRFQEIQIKNAFTSALKQHKLQEENVILAERIYKNSIFKQEIGGESNVSVTQKLNQLIMAQAEYTSTLIEVFRSKIELDKLYNKLTLK